MQKKKKRSRYVLCINNDAYPASLEILKVYRRLPDASAAARKLIRVVDESGEDYLYPQERFVPIAVPSVARKAFVSA